MKFGIVTMTPSSFQCAKISDKFSTTTHRYAPVFCARREYVTSNKTSFVDINWRDKYCRILWPTTYVRTSTRDLCGQRATHSVCSGAVEYRLLKNVVQRYSSEFLMCLSKTRSRDFLRHTKRPKQTNRISNTI